jgi:uncharacterized membrane protein YraQ (UPF0718 family)
MGLLPEFLTLLGIEIFAAMSLVSVLLDRDVPSSVRWLFQGAAGLGLGQLVVTEGFGTSSVIDASRFWISIFYLTLSVCSVAGMNIYLAAVRRKTAIASVFSGTITAPTVNVSVIFVSSYLSGVDVSFTLLTIVILIVPALLAGLCTYGFLRKTFKKIGKPSGSELSPASVPAPVETPKTYESLDLTSILGKWEESRTKKDPVA